MERIYHSLVSRLLLSVFLLWPALALAQSTIPLEVTPSDPEGAVISYRLADLDAMDQVTFQTTTIWTDGEVVFSGVPLKALLAGTDADGKSVEMIALNDYKVVMPLSELDDTAPIIATRMNGKTMSIRDKGPYWVVFPYDQDPKYQTETIYSYSIWQLSRLKTVD